STFIECHRLCRGKRTKLGRQMHLAEFLNLEEQYNFSNLTFTHNCTDIRQTELWVGGIALDYLLSNSPRQVPTSKWIWIHSGKSFEDGMGAWNPGEPNRVVQLNLEYEACVMVRPYSYPYSRHGLNDAHCSAVRPCVCEGAII
ncbi:C-type lectin domain family 4 member E, partial [Folsomia candida]